MFRLGPRRPVTLSGKIVSRCKAVPSRCGLRQPGGPADGPPWMPAKARHLVRLQTLYWFFRFGNPITVLLIDPRRTQTHRFPASS